MSDEDRARFEVLLEDIKTTVGVVADGHKFLNEKMQQLSRGQDEMAAKVEKISDGMTFLGIRVDTIKTDVGVLRSKVVKIENDVHHIAGRVDRIEHHLGLNGVTPKAKPKAPRKKK